MTLVTSLYDRVVNTFRRPIKDRMVYLHIPKCGGSAFRRAIRSCYLSIDIRKYREVAELDPAASDSVVKFRQQTDLPPYIAYEPSIFEFRESLLLYYMSSPKIRFISGHFGFSDAVYQASQGSFAFVTVLRHPVARWISAYFYNRYKASNHRKVDMDLDAYLESELGRRQGREYAHFLGGPHTKAGDGYSVLVDSAKENLHKLDVVAFLEYPKDFIEQFERRFGVRLRLHTTNESPVSKASRDSMITAERKSKIEEICAPDLEIYEYALTHLRANQNPSSKLE